MFVRNIEKGIEKFMTNMQKKEMMWENRYSLFLDIIMYVIFKVSAYRVSSDLMPFPYS